MGKNDVTATTTETAPEITTSKSFRSDPFSLFQERRKSKASEGNTADPNPQSMTATSPLEQDTLISMMRATRGMSPDEVKAFLAQKEDADKNTYKDDVSGLGC